MSKWLVLLAFPLLLLFTSTLEATPYYPNGIPSIGPLKGGNTFWGQNENNDEYFDGTGYGTSYKIKLPTKEILHLDISASIISYQHQGRKSTHSFSIPNNIEGFSGKLNILLLNPKEEPIKKTYEGWLNIPQTGVYFTGYPPFDFKEAKPNAQIAIQLILTNGETIYVRLDKQTSADLIFIARSFPD